VSINQSRNVRVAIVGCGQIADAHLQEIAKVETAQVVAVCDRDPDLAYQAAARFGIDRKYDDVDRMLTEVQPDVVHLTTPPHTHFSLASQCLLSGAHVYVEKPFALDADETRRLLALADAQHRLACVGHDHLFDPIWKEALHLVSAGKVGRIVHVDSSQGYDAGGPFGRLIQADAHHWIHRLPGGIFHNVISHAVCKVTPFLTDQHPEIVAMSFGSADLAPLPTELRVLVRGEAVSAHIAVFSLARPVRRVVRLHGTGGGLEVDFDAGLIRRMRASALPGAFGRIEAPWQQAVEAARNTRRALGRFFRSEIQYFAGMRALFDEFYRAILSGGAPPISYDEIQRVANIMDAVFEKTPCGGSTTLNHRQGSLTL
jgi:predicted dehydrogenase